MNTPADSSDSSDSVTSSPTPTRSAMRALTMLEARVVAVLVEKQQTVPDTYPLTLNSLTSGCNQKTARAPVMSASEADVLEAIDGLKQLSLVMEGSSSRVARFEHNMNRVLNLPSQSVALLTVLMLRGPQTTAELRMNSSRLHGFADNSSVEAFLDELAAHTPARVVRLPRTPGGRESRWMHLLCGEVDVQAMALTASSSGEASGSSGTLASEFDALKADHARISEDLRDLREIVEKLAGELGVDLASLRKSS